MTSALTFDAETHSYFLNERRVPSVTEIIRSHVQGWQAGQFYLDRGRAVHSAVALELDGKLDWDSVDDRIRGRVEAIIRFIHACGFKVVEKEHRMVSCGYQFAGTPDLIATDDEERYVLCDYKSTLEPSVEVQLGGYTILWNFDYPDQIIHRACALECHDDGTYKAKWFSGHELRNAANVFKAMLSVYGFKQKYNLNPKPVEA